MPKKRGGRRGKAKNAENKNFEDKNVDVTITSEKKTEVESTQEVKKFMGGSTSGYQIEEKQVGQKFQPNQQILEPPYKKLGGKGQGIIRGIPHKQQGGCTPFVSSVDKSQWSASRRSYIPLETGEYQKTSTAITAQEGGDMTSWGGARPRRPIITQIKSDAASKSEQLDLQFSMQSLSLNQSKDLVVYKPGTRGSPILIETNHMRLNLGNLKTIYRYDVSIEPEKKPKKMLRQAFQLFQAENFPNNNPSFDGQKLLISARKLPLANDTISSTVTVQTDRKEEISFAISVKLTGTVDLSQINNLLQKKNIKNIYQCIEIVLKQSYVNSFLNVGRRFYTAPSPGEYNLGCGTQMYLGGYQAVVQGSVPFLNCDVAHKAFTTSTSLLDLIIEMFGTKFKPLKIENLKNFEFLKWQWEQFNDYLKNLKVYYQIPKHPGSKKLYKINGLANKANYEKFQHQGQQTTVEEYFRNRWQSPLQFPNLPTLWVGAQNKKICIPIEMCTLKEKQPLEGWRLLAKQTSKMIGYSATPTYDRKNKILNIISKANHNANKNIQEFGFSINQNFEKLKARDLEKPSLEYSNEKIGQSNIQINKWSIIGLGLNYNRFKNEFFKLEKSIIDNGKSYNMSFGKAEAPYEFINGDHDPKNLKDALEKRKNYDLIIVVFLENKKDSYYNIKQIAEQQIGVLTQCVKSSTLERVNNKSIVCNLLLKINTKLNGINRIIINFDLISKVPTMVMGADVTHPSPQAKTIPSIVAVTATNNLTATAYTSTPYLQKPRETFSEIIQQLEDITILKLQYFKKQTNQLPKIIYFFRDGVSDGEFERVKNNEVAAIKKACLKFEQNYNPKLTFVIVQKRHHTRFFPTNEESTAKNDRNKNVPVGTCVDTIITNPTIQNFYLLSHQSIKGVGRPTKYSVLYDENNLSNDEIEILAYYLCCIYPRCNSSVSYPTPTYSAHLAAERYKVYLYKKNVDLDNLNQKLTETHQGFAEKYPMYFY